MKTLDQSLEYAQMYDALESTPIEFQQKLIQALNSIGETLGQNPVEMFNVVLCGNQQEDVRKKLYNWWRGFFEILSSCDIPDESKKEYDDKIDALISEITKSGSSVDLSEPTDSQEVVSEDYEQASKDDENKMLKDMKFAISKIGEIANKVQDIINFVNPYCKKDNDIYEEKTEMKSESLVETFGQEEQIYRDYVFGYISEQDAVSSLMDAFDMPSDIADDRVYNWYGTMADFSELIENIKNGTKDWIDLRDFIINEDLYDEQNEYIDDVVQSVLEEYDISKSVSESSEKTLYELGNEEVEVTYYLPDNLKDKPEDKSLYPMKSKLKDISYWYSGNYDRVNVEVDGKKIMVYRTSSPNDYEYFTFENPEDEKKFLEYSDILDKERRRKFDAISERQDMNKNINENEGILIGDNEIDSPSEGGQYLIEPDVGENDKDVFAVYFKIYEEDDWEYQCTFDTRKEAEDWIDSEIEYAEKNNKGHEKYDEKSSGEWVSIDSLIDETSDDEDDEFDDEFEPDYHIGEYVIWDDPDGDPSGDWEITDIKQTGDGIVYTINKDDGSEAEVPEDEICLDGNYKVDGVDFEDVDESNSEKENDDEIKNTSPKKFKNDNGSTSELVTGSKKQVSEMTIQQEIDDPSELLNLLWGQGRDNLRELRDSGVVSNEFLMSMIDDMMGTEEPPTLTAINDLFAYDFESILEPLGIDVEHYRDTLEIVKKNDSVELESTKVESTNK